MIYADLNQPYTVPQEVAKCPACDGSIVLELNEWETDALGIIPTDGCHFSCADEPDIFDEAAWELWDDGHKYTHDMPYVYWLPVEEKALAWIREHVRFTDREKEQRKLEAWKKAITGE